jgi:hypothetical protein
MSNNHTVVLAFCCSEIYRLIQGSKITAIAIPNENLAEIRILPARSKTKLYSDGRYGTCLAVTKYIPKNSVTPNDRNRKVKVLININEFGLPIESFIEDADGKLLFESLKNFGFQLYPIRSTCINQMGDLLVLRNEKLYSLHITRFNPTVNRPDNRLRLRHYLIGKISFQTFSAKEKLDPICIVIMHSDLDGKRVITKKVLDFFTSMNLQVILSDFKPNWQYLVSQKIVELIDSTSAP